MSSTSPVNWSDEEETELYHDPEDGFVYRRKKRPRITPSSSSSTLPPPPDPEQEEKKRREWRKATLLKIKEKYLKEISRWELLSNSLCAMENREKRDVVLGNEPSGSDQNMDSENGSESVLDELMLKVEAQEAMIHDVSNLCDMAESICNAQEEYLKQTFIDLPIWDSPRQLMESLCDD